MSTSKVLLRCSHARSFAHCLGLLWQSWAIMTETTPPTKPKGVSIQPWMERAGWPLMWLCLEKETATYSSVLAWRIPGTAEPGGLTSMGSHRVGHDWSDLAVAVAWKFNIPHMISSLNTSFIIAEFPRLFIIDSLVILTIIQLFCCELGFPAV